MDPYGIWGWLTVGGLLVLGILCLIGLGLVLDNGWDREHHPERYRP